MYSGILRPKEDKIMKRFEQHENLMEGSKHLSSEQQAPIVVLERHRDYTSNGSVQVMLFADRLEVWNPGALPPSLTLEKLRVAHGSVPGNPLLAESLYLTKYIERMDTGTDDMIRRCKAAGLAEPEFMVSDGFRAIVRRQPDSQPESQLKSQGKSLEMRVLILLDGGSMGKLELSRRLGQREISGQLNKVVRSLLDNQIIEYTIPSKPKSRLQKYRLTEKGKATLKAWEQGERKI